MKPVDLVIEFAKSYLGISEGSQKHSEIINLYNKARYSDAYQMTLADPWCCAFVVGMFQAAGVPDIVPGYAYCDGMIQTFRQWGRWKNRIGYTPQKGDVIFYDWNGDGSSDHVGIVTDYSFGTVTAIEGNKSDTVGYRKIGVDSPQIIGYGIPNYPGAVPDQGQQPDTGLKDDSLDLEYIRTLPLLQMGSEGVYVKIPQVFLNYYNSANLEVDGEFGPATKKDDSLDREYIRTLPLLQMGSEGIYVKILQVFLNYYNSANLEVDGEFGPATKKAVTDYQTKHKLETDGIVGRETWTQLLLK